jgi:hypothetical protein
MENIDTINNSTYIENITDMYIIYVDGVAKSFVKDEKDIFEKLFTIARELSTKEFFDGYRTDCVAVSDKEFHVVGTYRFFLIGYETILHRITYKKISPYETYITV